MMGQAYGDAVTLGIVIAAGAVLLLAAVVIGLLSATGRGSPALRRELWLRLGSWAVLLPLMLGPVLLGRPWVIGAVTLLGLLCLREYDRATGLFREPVMAGAVAVGIVFVNFAALDHWYNFVTAQLLLLGSAHPQLGDQAGGVGGEGLQDLPALLFRRRENRADDRELRGSGHGAKAAGDLLS